MELGVSRNSSHIHPYQRLLHNGYQSEPGAPSEPTGSGISSSSIGISSSGGLFSSVATTPPSVASICQPPVIQYRPIQPQDYQVLVEVHESLFPIKYDHDFYSSVVHGRGVLSWAAVDVAKSDDLIGFVTVRVLSLAESEKQEPGLLERAHLSSSGDRCLIYILTLGVTKPYRNAGVASTLIWKVTEYARNCATCQAVYLHVIAYNHAAIAFYRKNGFACRRRVHNFYSIGARSHDAFVYVHYVNGSRPASAPLDFFTSVSLFLRSMLHAVMARLFGRKQDCLDAADDDDDDKAAKWPSKCPDPCGSSIWHFQPSSRANSIYVTCQ